MGCFEWQKDKWFQKMIRWIEGRKVFWLLSTSVHLPQEVPKPPADESHQGILREIRLDTEQIYSHHCMIHYWPQSEAGPRLPTKDYSLRICIGLYRKGTNLCTSSCFWEISTENPTRSEVCITDCSSVHSSCLWVSGKLIHERQAIRWADDVIHFDDCKLSAIAHIPPLQHRYLKDILKLQSVWHGITIFWIPLSLYSHYFCKTRHKVPTEIAILLKDIPMVQSKQKYLVSSHASTLSPSFKPPLRNSLFIKKKKPHC